MTETRLAIIIVFVFSALTVLADVLIKKASDQNQLWSPYFIAGALIYGTSAFGWFYALRVLNLATLGGIYSLATVVMIALAGVLIFKEKLQVVEIAVLAMALLSIVMLWRLL
ncbi:MAG: transporter [Pseudomonadota bacterium]